MKGVYALIIEIKHRVTMAVGALGVLSLDKGYWVYIGSAMGEGSTSIENRLRRHFRKQKSIYWHIDYVLDAGARSIRAVWGKADTPMECKLAGLLVSHQSFTQGPQGFGASDCRAKCRTHLFLYSNSKSLPNVLEGIFRELDLQPRTFNNNEMNGLMNKG